MIWIQLTTLFTLVKPLGFDSLSNVSNRRFFSKSSVSPVLLVPNYVIYISKSELLFSNCRKDALVSFRRSSAMVCCYAFRIKVLSIRSRDLSNNYTPVNSYERIRSTHPCCWIQQIMKFKPKNANFTQQVSKWFKSSTLIHCQDLVRNSLYYLSYNYYNVNLEILV